MRVLQLLVRAQHTQSENPNSISTEHWICTERKKGRKTGCDTCEISDTALKGFIAQVLDIETFDQEVFNERIDHIDMQGKDHYTFHTPMAPAARTRGDQT